MSEGATPSAWHNSISIPYVILASIVASLGLLAVLFWVITFYWPLFLGVVPAALGGLMLFHPLAGSNSAR